MAAIIEIVWPPAALSGHAKGRSYHRKAALTAKHRAWAKAATLAVKVPAFPGKGDIPISFTFIPPDWRGDRTNFPNRIKAGIDGIADALGVNDRRFLPSYHYRDPDSGNPRVIVTIG